MNLRKVYELRQTQSLVDRYLVARVFKLDDLWGLADASGYLWPIWDKDDLFNNITSHDVIHAQWRFEKVQDNLKLVLLSTREVVQSNKQWPFSTIADPLYFAHLESSILKKTESIYATCYFESLQIDRARKIAQRELIHNRTRDFFYNRGFHHMRTSTLVPSGGVDEYLNTFTTKYEDFKGNFWPLGLPTSPEFSLKKLITQGFKKVFQIATAYRNKGELSRWHEPEFTMLEWYRVGDPLEVIMQDTAKLIYELAKVLGVDVSLPVEWPAYSIENLFLQFYDLDLSQLQDVKEFYSAARHHCFSLESSDDWNTIFHKLFFEKIEKFLAKQPACFVTNFPVQMAALAKQLSSDRPYVSRFEAYMHGVEVCNGFGELNDAREMTSRFDAVQNLRPFDIQRDEIFEKSMYYGMPPCSGNAVGLDRVTALLLDTENISDLFATPFQSHFLNEQHIQKR